MPAPSEAELAQLAQQFLMRVKLNGREVPAYSAIMNWLSSIAEPEPTSDIPDREPINPPGDRPIPRPATPPDNPDNPKP